MKLRRLLLIALCSLLWALAAPRVQAQTATAREGQQTIVRPMPERMRGKLFGAGVAGTAIALAASTGIFAVVAAASSCDCDDEAFVAGVNGLAAGGAFAALAVPISSAVFVYRIGKKNGYAGKWSAAIAGATVSLFVGGLASIGTYFLFTSAFGVDPVISLLPTAAVGISAIAGLTALSFRLSDQRQVRLAPLLSPSAETRGLSLGISGRF